MTKIKLIKKKGKGLNINVYKTLKKAIYSGYMVPGKKLTETSLASMLNVSRTPIREALKKLEADNLVTRDSRGLKVVRLSPVDVKEMYYIAGILEGSAAEMAIDNINETHISKFRDIQVKLGEAELRKEYEKWLKLNNQFHSVYLSVCSNSNLLKLLYDNSRPLPRYWYYICSDPAILAKSYEEHEKIIDAFLNKDARLVRYLVENHITIVAKRLKEHLENIPII